LLHNVISQLILKKDIDTKKTLSALKRKEEYFGFGKKQRNTTRKVIIR